MIDAAALGDRHFQIAAAGSLDLSRVTVTGGADTVSGGFQVVGELNIDQASIADNRMGAVGGIDLQTGGSATITRSVLTSNNGQFTGAAIVNSGSTLTLTETVVANNTKQATPQSTPSIHDIIVQPGGTLVSGGKNLLTTTPTGSTGIQHNQNGDHIGSVDYVVTTVADTFNEDPDTARLSAREAVHLANTNAGLEEIWMPGWEFLLTRDRSDRFNGGNTATDADVAFGDLDVRDSLVLRGIDGATKFDWKASVNDSVFELLGDYDKSGLVDAGDDVDDNAVWDDQFGDGSGSPIDWEVYAADGNDDGVVNAADYTAWADNVGNTLDLEGVTV